MRNIARFLFRILFFDSTREKKKTAGGALRWAISQTHSEILWSFNFEMGMGDICGYELTNRENSGIIIQANLLVLFIPKLTCQVANCGTY